MQEQMHTHENLSPEDISLENIHPHTFVKDSERRPDSEGEPKEQTALRKALEKFLDRFRAKGETQVDTPVQAEVETKGETVATALGLIKEVFILHALREKGVTCVPEVLESQSGWITKDRAPHKAYSFASAALKKIDGLDLSQYDTGNETATIAVFTKVAFALNQIHRANIIHNDIKPANIMLTSTGEVVIIDFNISDVMREDGTIVAEGGTPEYNSPEKEFEGHICDVRSDIYSLTMTLAEKLGVDVHELQCSPPEYRRQRLIEFVERLVEEETISPKMGTFILWNTAQEKELRCDNYEEYTEILEMVSDPAVTFDVLSERFMRKLNEQNN